MCFGKKYFGPKRRIHVSKDDELVVFLDDFLTTCLIKIQFGVRFSWNKRRSKEDEEETVICCI